VVAQLALPARTSDRGSDASRACDHADAGQFRYGVIRC
jgi:hypothetical protein